MQLANTLLARQLHNALLTKPEIRWHLMAGHGEKLGRKQEDAIALLTQRNIEEAARAAG